MNFPTIKGLKYHYKSVSVKHLDELQEDFDHLNRKGVLSNHETYRYYLSNKKFIIPETLPDAKSLIVLATSTRMMNVNFHLNGNVYDIMVPPPYYDDGLTFEDLDDLVLNEIIKKPGHEIIKVRNQLHLKLLAVRSGLGAYGRNNLCYVDGMGSFCTLHAYYTNYKMEHDSWYELKMMDLCENCSYCIDNCPTNAIRGDPFVIDAGKCLPLYNEIDGKIPDWMDENIHHSLMGCMICQYNCPGNKEEIKKAGRFEDISEKETKMLLNGDFSEELASILDTKLKIPYGIDYLPRLKRNLELVIKSNKSNSI